MACKSGRTYYCMPNLACMGNGVRTAGPKVDNSVKIAVFWLFEQHILIKAKSVTELLIVYSCRPYLALISKG